MDLITAVAVLLSQISETYSIANTLSNQGNIINDVANSGNSIPEVNPQIKALLGSMDVTMTSLKSQTVLLQQAIDAVTEIVT